MTVEIDGVTVRKLGFLGLGVMGESMCRNLAAKVRLPVLGYDLRAEPIQRLASVGVTGCHSLTGLAGN